VDRAAGHARGGERRQRFSPHRTAGVQGEAALHSFAGQFPRDLADGGVGDGYDDAGNALWQGRAQVRRPSVVTDKGGRPLSACGVTPRQGHDRHSVFGEQTAQRLRHAACSGDEDRFL